MIPNLQRLWFRPEGRTSNATKKSIFVYYNDLYDERVVVLPASLATEFQRPSPWRRTYSIKRRSSSLVHGPFLQTSSTIPHQLILLSDFVLRKYLICFLYWILPICFSIWHFFFFVMETLWCSGLMFIIFLYMHWQSLLGSITFLPHYLFVCM